MKNSGAFWILTVLMVFVFHVVLTGPVSIYGVNPNFFLLSTIFFAIRGGPILGEILGFIFGIIADATSISIFGSQTFMLTLIGYLVGRLERHVDEEKYSAQMVLVFLMSCLNLIGLLFLETLFRGVTQGFRSKSVILNPLYSTLFSPILFWVMLQWCSVFRRTDLKVKV